MSLKINIFIPSLKSFYSSTALHYLRNHTIFKIYLVKELLLLSSFLNISEGELLVTMSIVFLDDYAQDIMLRGLNQIILPPVLSRRNPNGHQENIEEGLQIYYQNMNVDKRVLKAVNGWKHIYGMLKGITWSIRTNQKLMKTMLEI